MINNLSGFLADPSLCIHSGLDYMMLAGKVFINGLMAQDMESLYIGEMVNQIIIMVRKTVFRCPEQMGNGMIITVPKRNLTSANLKPV
jgi:hypothetical protein